ncbi:copper chaperone CopZ [Mobilicoccus pelagius NBRC 104925]|uniref:Copper chaperone CopZ n=2 Tax=Mobilicoccus TaxID=984996 RepID=H5USN1_9MICO|nr:copper chaperone CopZ [Mobilicoccus pelagius NBRC 104925]
MQKAGADAVAHPPPDHRPSTRGVEMATATYTVTGMTCEHCVASVKEEVGEIPGVTGVDVDLASGRLDVTSEGDVDRSAVESAVTEAGYQLS